MNKAKTTRMGPTLTNGSRHYSYKAIYGPIGVTPFTSSQTSSCPDPATLGYDATNSVLDYIQREYIKTHPSSCTHYMLTSGDNYYVPLLWKHLQAKFDQEYELIGWDRISHYRNYVQKHAKLGETKIDLGSFVVHANRLSEKTRLKMLKKADGLFFEKIAKAVSEEHALLIEEVLMVHI